MLKKKLKLSTLSETMLKDKEMNGLWGGERKCTCSCMYTEQNGITWEQNSAANYELGETGGYSVGGGNNYWTMEFDDGGLTGRAPNYQEMHA